MPEQNKKDKDEERQLQEVAGAGAKENGAGSGVPPLGPSLDPDPKPVANDVENESVPVNSTPESAKQAKEEDEDSTSYDDEKTEQAINEIVAKEGDELLAVQDAGSMRGGVKFKAGGSASSRFWRSKLLRLTLLFLFLCGAAVLFTMPKTRYWALNHANVRSSASVVVVDSTTQLPLKGVHVTIGDQSANTDSDGKAKFTNLMLGPAELSVSQVGFDEITRNITIGWGSNPLGSFALKATGVQYVIEVRDYLSDQSLEGVEATNGTVTAISDKKGKITLTLESTVASSDGVSLSKPGYRTEKVTLNEDPKKLAKAVMVPSRKTAFATKQNGKYDVYKTDLDGKNREVLLPGTGAENGNITLVVSPDGSRAALVSTRENRRDSDGFLLSTLTLINIESGAKVTIAESSQIQLIDWIGQRLIFQQASSDSTAGNRYTVVSYNYADNTRLQLAAANRLSTVMSAQSIVYYAVAADATNPSVQVGLFRISPDGSGKQRIFETEISTVLRSTYNTFSVQTAEGIWYTYDVANGSKSQVDSPGSLANRMYIDNSGRTKSLWINQGTLTSYDVASSKETVVETQGGLAYPVQWLGDTAAIYRIANGAEIADYAVSLAGGTPHKIADVALSYGFAQAQ
ncbi:MAG TPA: carboxypeptidase-like regulatory domain-containing protein [Candidatus Saccharimonadales bacterium]